MALTQQQIFELGLIKENSASPEILAKILEHILLELPDNGYYDKIAETFKYLLDTIAEHEATIDDLYERVKKMEELMSYSSILQK